ncbi:prepilin-type N-terminal cleavage/methylation domain-containing protein [Bacteriovoracaceae bacterium]|nr:prepilin-type N-terminal cleavage/methylation domain-containing protein [Bacteriovoracaceae bacterium]
MVKRVNVYSHSGMTLIEVMIAMALFSVFIVAFFSSQGQTLFDSTRIKKELFLKDLAELKINEIIVNPPPFKDSLTSASKETKAFEDYPNYTYTIEIKKLTIPDLSKLMNNSESEDSNDDQDAQQADVKQRVLKAFKDNMEKMIWQAQVTVEDKESGEKYFLNTWLYNNKANINVQAF